MDIENLMVWLRSHDKPTLEALAQSTGVPFHTLRKIASGETKNPGVYTMLPIAEMFGRVRRGRRKVAAK
jgi:transcriptional regulator with XRE-family HTH domain